MAFWRTARPVRTVCRLAAGGPRLWSDAVRATLELARARWRLGHRSTRELIALARRPVAPGPLPCPAPDDLIDRVAFAVPRLAACVPWRADCWIQAMAAQAWLSRAGIASDIYIGVRTDPDRGFEAHAWLRQAGRVVTGGDVSGFVPLVTPESPQPD